MICDQLGDELFFVEDVYRLIDVYYCENLRANKHVFKFIVFLNFVHSNKIRIIYI